jgi:hypothetical protein
LLSTPTFLPAEVRLFLFADASFSVDTGQLKGSFHPDFVASLVASFVDRCPEAARAGSLVLVSTKLATKGRTEKYP